MDMMQKLGWRFDEKALQVDFEAAIGRPADEVRLNWYRAIAPYLVLAYEKGRDGGELTELFPFLLPMG